jgi:hypothetical protein
MGENDYVLICKCFAPASLLEAAEGHTEDAAVYHHHRRQKRKYFGTCAVVADEKVLE